MGVRFHTEAARAKMRAAWQRRREHLPGFWDRVRPVGDCLVWTGGLSSGYGSVWIKGRTRLAHRIAWEEAFGPIPSDLQVDHLCRNRACVNPAHMELVTNRENVLRGEGPSAKNARATHCKRGHEFTPANTYLMKRGKRACRECSLASWRRRHPSREYLRRVNPPPADPMQLEETA